MSDQSRRKLLKSIAAGSGAIVAGKSLPENWVRPVVDSMLLPAHAQTSCAFSISETSTLPFSLTPPGPNVLTSSGGTLTVTVTPAPQDGEMVFLEIFVDGALEAETNRPLTGGVSIDDHGTVIPGLYEWRATYNCAVTSIYMNVISAPGNISALGNSIAPAGNSDFFSR